VFRALRPPSLLAVVLAAAAMLPAVPATAQQHGTPVFDRFNFKLEGSWVGLSTQFRLDSEVLGEGTILSFEDDLDLDSNKNIPTVAFEWQIGRRHRLGVRWQDIDRSSSSQTLREIQWGDEIIPIEAEVALGFDLTQTFVDYAYFPWVKQRWAAGFGLGFRWLDLSASLAWRGGAFEVEGDTDAKGAAPVPYLYFEYRRLFGDHWRVIAGAGWLDVTVDDISGHQYVGRLGAEYLLGRHWGLGAAVNLSTISVYWKGLQVEDSGSLLSADITMDINDFSVFVRARF
jgi:hypothetical protein